LKYCRLSNKINQNPKTCSRICAAMRPRLWLSVSYEIGAIVAFTRLCSKYKTFQECPTYDLTVKVSATCANANCCLIVHLVESNALPLYKREATFRWRKVEWFLLRKKEKREQTASPFFIKRRIFVGFSLFACPCPLLSALLGDARCVRLSPPPP
jgi:hypothetical protein